MEVGTLCREPMLVRETRLRQIWNVARLWLQDVCWGWKGHDLALSDSKETNKRWDDNA
jgi:hypothetical protein